MPAFSTISEQKLATCDPRLQLLLREAIKHVDFTILCGHRTKAEQDLAVAEKKSKTPFPLSKHNSFPSKAVDVAPWLPVVKIDWKDVAAFARLAGYIQCIADQQGIKIRWGGDWNGNWRTAGTEPGEAFLDAPHIELVE